METTEQKQAKIAALSLAYTRLSLDVRDLKSSPLQAQREIAPHLEKIARDLESQYHYLASLAEMEEHAPSLYLLWMAHDKGQYRGLPFLAVESLNPLVSAASDDVFVAFTDSDHNLRPLVYIHPCESSDLHVVSIREASETLGYSLDSLTFNSYSKSGKQIIQYWLDQTGQYWH